MTKNFNFALKIKAGGREGGTCEVLLPCHPPKKEFGRCTNPSVSFFGFSCNCAGYLWSSRVFTFCMHGS